MDNKKLTTIKCDPKTRAKLKKMAKKQGMWMYVVLHLAVLELEDNWKKHGSL